MSAATRFTDLLKLLLGERPRHKEIAAETHPGVPEEPPAPLFSLSETRQELVASYVENPKHESQ